MYQIIDYFGNLFSVEGFPPRWVCGLWTPFHGWLYILSDIGIWAAYFTIPVFLLYFVRSRRDFPFNNIFWLFAAFIFACGTTHLMDAIMFWWPAYRLSGLVYFATAVISWMTILALFKVMPLALSLKTPTQLQKIIEEQTSELAESNRRLAQANEKLQLYTSRLEHSNRELEQFAIVASHDLQEPLRKVQMFGSYLKETAKGLDSESRDYVDRMQNATNRMQMLITDLLNLSRINRRGQPFKDEDLALILQEALADLAPLIKETGGHVEVGQMVTLPVDASQMRQLFQNLIGNGLKFHRQDVLPVIKVEARLIADKKCEIIVEDNGVGFDENHRERIFQIFERLSGRNIEGTGIGLAICKRIAERHGGSIDATSTPGEGSKFTVILPVVQPEPTIEIEAEPQNTPA